MRKKLLQLLIYSFKATQPLGNDKAKESVYIFANAKEIKGEDDEASD